MSKENSRELRNCLGEFATGVTIITCLFEEKRIGVTANSFSALSLDPPLVLWSLGSKSSSLQAFKESGYFGVNVLSQKQQDLAMTFSKSAVDKFDGVQSVAGFEGIPLLEGSLAQFECRVVQAIEQGDHCLFIGEVVECRRATAATEQSLLFARGKFASIAYDPVVEEVPESVALNHQSIFYKDYLPYLLARAANDSAGRFHQSLKQFGLTMLSWRVLACLSDGLPWTVNDLCRISLAKQPTVSKLLDRLETQRLIRRKSDAADARRVMVTLTKAGIEKIAPVIAQAQGYGKELADQFAEGDLDRLKTVLRSLIDER